MAKKNTATVETASEKTEATVKVKLADKISALKAQAEEDPVISGSMGALDQLEENCAAAKAAFKSANKRLRNFVNALSK